MICAWKELLAILPPSMRSSIDEVGKGSMQELRLRINAPPEIVLSGGRKWLSEKVNQEDLNFVINTATHYSPWTADSVSQGFLTAPGGHRIGICGEVVKKNGTVTGIRAVRSLCIRVARDFSGIASGISGMESSTLILGAPGTGKTTLLRDLIRQRSHDRYVGVVDERFELFPDGFLQGKLMDVLSGCTKEQGMEMLIRTMNPDYIAVDEITSEDDSLSLARAAHCGVRLMATAHAENLDGFYRRKVYHPLWEHSVFQTAVILQSDKTYTVERIKPCDY